MFVIPLGARYNFLKLVSTMAGYIELKSFIGKFYYLLKCGMHADLHLLCFAGQVYVNLQAGLGYIQPPPIHQ